MKNIFIVLILGLSIGCSQQKSEINVLPPSAPYSIGDKENLNKRYAFEQLRLSDPVTRTIPSNIHQRSLEFSKNIMRKQQAEARIVSQNYELTGPSNVGGRTRALAIDINDDEHLIAGGVSGGMWYSENGGESWTRSSQTNIINSVTCVVQDSRQSKSQTWYYGTGELRGNSARSVDAQYRGDGIFKSVDNGMSWDVLPSTANNQLTDFESPFNYVWNLDMDRSNSEEEVLYAALYGNVVKSNNGGETWTVALGEPNLLEDQSGDLNNSNASFYTNVMITPSGKAYAYLSTSTAMNDVTLNKGLFSSTDGENWENITPNGFTSLSQRTVMSFAPGNEDIVYFLVEGSQLQLWKLDGEVWSNRTANIPDGSGELEELDTQGSYNMTIKVHPTDENTVFIGGTNLYRSQDGFASKNAIIQIGGYDTENHTSLYSNHHPDQHELVFLEDEDQMLSANDGGVYKTFNNQASEVSWVSLNNGYVTTQFYSIAVSKKAADHRIIGGMQDNGTYLKTTNDHESPWISVIGGDGSYTASTPDNQYWYASFQNGNIFKLGYDENDNLQSWAKVDPLGVNSDDYLFIAPFILDPNSYNRMYLAAGNSIWRNDNLHQIKNGVQVSTAVNWSQIKSENINSSISALDVSTNIESKVVFGTANGELHQIQEANGLSPTPTLLFAQEGFVSSISIDPTDASKVLAAYSNYHIPSLFYSKNNGSSFEDVGGNLEENLDGTGNGPSIRWCEIIPLQNGLYKYFVGTSVGLFSTDELNGNSTEWSLEGGESIGHSVVTMMDYRSVDGTLVIATHGNGIFQTTLDDPLEFENAEELSAVSLNNAFPNPFTEQITIQLTLPSAGLVEIFIATSLGKRIRTIVSQYHFEGEVSATWDGTNNSGLEVPKGIYYYVVNFEGKLSSGKLIKDWQVK